jgi:hypothetical protein
MSEYFNQGDALIRSEKDLYDIKLDQISMIMAYITTTCS